eukprot:2372817-Ditylum_brightwellii.AAC.1
MEQQGLEHYRVGMALHNIGIVKSRRRSTFWRKRRGAALGQAVIQLATICGVGGIYAPVWKGNAPVATELYVE